MSTILGYICFSFLAIALANCNRVMLWSSVHLRQQFISVSQNFLCTKIQGNWQKGWVDEHLKRNHESVHAQVVKTLQCCSIALSIKEIHRKNCMSQLLCWSSLFVVPSNNSLKVVPSLPTISSNPKIIPQGKQATVREIYFLHSFKKNESFFA